MWSVGKGVVPLVHICLLSETPYRVSMMKWCPMEPLGLVSVNGVYDSTVGPNTPADKLFKRSTAPRFSLVPTATPKMETMKEGGELTLDGVQSGRHAMTNQ